MTNIKFKQIRSKWTLFQKFRPNNYNKAPVKENKTIHQGLKQQKKKIHHSR